MKLILEAYFAGNEEIIMSRDLNYFNFHVFMAEFFDWFNLTLENRECLKFQATMKFKNKIVFRYTDLRGYNDIDLILLAAILTRQFTPADNV